jgi:hypothetical protein
MQLSIHYYVLSLSEQMNKLYEGFRDKLIDIQDKNFPHEITVTKDKPACTGAQLKKFFKQTDQRFGYYYKHDPLRLVLVGDRKSLAIFKTLSKHWDQCIGIVEGKYIATSAHDLGMIVWPIVKEAIAGATEDAMRALAVAAEAKQVVSGIDAVEQLVEAGTGSTLYVEEDYHVKVSIYKTDHSLVFSKHVDIWEVIDDVVDLIIEKVLKKGGRVIFLNNGSLIKFERIALIQKQ